MSEESAYSQFDLFNACLVSAVAIFGVLDIASFEHTVILLLALIAISLVRQGDTV